MIGFAEEVTRNYVEKWSTPFEKKMHLIPWKYEDLTEIGFDQKEEDPSYFLVSILAVIILSQ